LLFGIVIPGVFFILSVERRNENSAKRQSRRRKQETTQSVNYIDSSPTIDSRRSEFGVVDAT
jgi:hypothetical protein